MEQAPERLADLARAGAQVRIVCRRCGFEEDWTPERLSEHLAGIGGADLWSEVTRHLRCARFGCGSQEMRALAVPHGGRPANMPRRVGRLDTQLLGAALGVLDAAARRSRGRAVATLEVRLALLVVHRHARDGECVRRFWLRASTGNRTADDSLAEPLQVIRQRLVAAGWLAPSFLLEPLKMWPWKSPAPPGWKSADGTD